MDQPRIEPLSGRAGLALVDPHEGVRYELHVPDRQSPVGLSRPAVSEDALPVPVDDLTGVTTAQLVVPNDLRVIVRTLGFDRLGTLREHGPLQPDRRYLLELASTPCKVYLTAPGGWQTDHGNRQVELRWPERVEVDVAMRSLYDGPAATVTVPEDVHSEARAISLLGTGLDTTSPERSWPTLRGHPPLFERGETFDAPDPLAPPTPGVEFRVPPDRSYLYPLAPLAYYTGGRVSVEPGEDPALAAGGERWPLPRTDYCGTVNRLLQRFVYLDCLCRTAGLYEERLVEHADLAAAVDGEVDWDRLYNMPADERVAAYLKPRFDVVTDADLAPAWPTTADLSDGPSGFDLLPYVAGELAMVRLDDAEPGQVGGAGATVDGRPIADGAGQTARPDTAVRPPDVETPEHCWLRPERPLNAARPTEDAVRRWTEQSPRDAALSVDLVCNDAAMSDEVIEDIYDVRDILELDLSLHLRLSRSELRDVFESQSDLVHYVGHVDENGMECSDGSLDASEVSNAPDTVLLNACNTYEQGMKLLDAGALASVVTLSEISNLSATRIGQVFARLLSAGFRVRAAVSILREYVSNGYQYLSLGAGDLQLVQASSGTPFLLEVGPGSAKDSFSVSLQYFPTRAYHIGARTTPELTAIERPHLAVGRSPNWQVGADDLKTYITREHFPVVVGGQLVWSDELALALEEADGSHHEVIDRVLRGIWGDVTAADKLRLPG